MKFGGVDIAIERKWLRITYNPKVDGYPKVGTVIELRDHRMLSDGKYLVTGVTEYEPGVCDGRDIRLDLLSEGIMAEGRGWSGENLVKAMVANL